MIGVVLVRFLTVDFLNAKKAPGISISFEVDWCEDAQVDMLEVHAGI